MDVMLCRADSLLFVIHCRGPVCPQRPHKAIDVFHLISAAKPAIILVTAPSGPTLFNSHQQTEITARERGEEWPESKIINI